MDQISNFFSHLFYIRDVAHLTHLRQPDRSLATHEAMKLLYTEILDLADALIESYQGMNDIVPITIKESSYTNTPIAFIKESYYFIENNRNIFSTTHNQNIIDEICALLSKCAFLLRFVQ